MMQDGLDFLFQFQMEEKPQPHRPVGAALIQRSEHGRPLLGLGQAFLPFEIEKGKVKSSI